jgi:hypothetical protein
MVMCGTINNLKLLPDEKDYFRVCLCNKGKKSPIFVHKLVMLMFIGDPPDDFERPSVDHINGIITDNHVTNLRWSTPILQAANLRRVNQQGAVRAVNQYTMKGEFIQSFSSVAAAGKAVGCTGTNIAHCCKSINKHAKGFIWKYVDAELVYENEVWKKVSFHNFESIKISNYGRFLMRNGRKSFGRPTGKYLRVALKSKKTGKWKNFRAHRVIMAGFTGENKKLVVNHKNGNKKDNHIDNLEYITQKANVKHALETGLTKPSNASGRAVIVTYEDGKEVEYPSYAAASNATGQSRKMISKLCSDPDYNPAPKKCKNPINFTIRRK